MKKLFVIIFALVGVLGAQTINDAGGFGGSVAIKTITSWTPFTSDSLAVAVSDPIDITGVDSIHVWSSAISANGTAKLVAGVYGSFSSTFATTTADSQFAAIDTTNAKLETLNYYTTGFPKGSPYAFVRVNGDAL
jgi:hypothetical protein